MFKHEQEFNLYYKLQTIVSSKTGFTRKKIILIQAKKKNSSILNDFIFEYKSR